jgi:prevent-host-death family protein
MTERRYAAMMTSVLGVAEAKRRFAELLDRVLRGEQFVVARRGRPVAALVPAGRATESAGEPLGLAAVAGALADWDDLDETMAVIVAARKQERGRPAPALD